jgi:hypothetical protein
MNGINFQRGLFCISYFKAFGFRRLWVGSWNGQLLSYRNRFSMHILCGFDRASSILCGNKMPTRCNRCSFLYMITVVFLCLQMWLRHFSLWLFVGCFFAICCCLLCVWLMFWWVFCICFSFFVAMMRKASVVSSWHFISTYLNVHICLVANCEGTAVAEATKRYFKSSAL